MIRTLLRNYVHFFSRRRSRFVDLCGATALSTLALLGAVSAARGQNLVNAPSVLVEENAVRKVSEHVWVIDAKNRVLVPNIGIVVGNRATLVVDTGMGPRSGEVVLREVQRLSKNPILYLTFTHFHPEHSSGEQAFPSNTIVIYPEAQQEDINLHLERFLTLFSGRTPEIKDLLKDVHLRPADILLQSDGKIDLGGITARILYFGPAHTHGDTLVYVEPDGVLIPGDIVQIRLFPNIPDSTGSASNWLAMLDKVEALHPRIIVPDHGSFPADASFIGKERDYLSALKSRVIELKRQGKSAEEAGKILTPEFTAKYPDWGGANGIAAVTQRFYEELR